MPAQNGQIYCDRGRGIWNIDELNMERNITERIRKLYSKGDGKLMLYVEKDILN